jgi:hypothetical protein
MNLQSRLKAIQPMVIILVLVNLTDAPISKYFLTISKSALAAGTYSVLPILGPGTFANLTSSASGGFSKYVPVTLVPGVRYAYTAIAFEIIWPCLFN